MLFDDGDDFVYFGLDGFVVAIVGDTNTSVVAIVLVYDGKVGGDVADEGYGEFFFGGGSVTVDFISEIGDFGDTAHFGEVADGDFFGGGKFGDLSFF